MKNDYVDPLFQEVLNSVPQRVKGEVDRSFDLSSRIDTLLREKGWTKTDLARKTGKKSAEVSKWLSGTQNFTLRTIALIEEALGCKLLRVVGTDDAHSTINVHYVISVSTAPTADQAWRQPGQRTKRGETIHLMNQWL